jgi:O-antigen/teichoic acid export membrane protein
MFLSQLLAHVRLPLFRNGYALLFSGAATSALGFLYWALAARLYPPEAVGINSALLSAMMLLSGMAQLSLNNVLIRFIPVAGQHTGQLLGWSYVASTVAAIVCGVVFMVGIDVWSPALGFLNQSGGWPWAFGATIIGWSIFSLQDSALTGLRQTVWVPIENTFFAVFKIVLLVIFTTVLPTAGIFLSWTIPVLISLLPINGLIFGRLLPQRTIDSSNQTAAPTTKDILRYVGGNYIGTLFFLVYTNLLPLLVVNGTSTEDAAYFYLPWTIAAGMQLIAINMATSLTVEAALNQRELHSYGRRVLNQSLRLLVPLVAVIFIGAPWILTIFGKNYSEEGTVLLRWLSLSAIPNVVVVLALGLARVQNRPVVIATIQGLLCAIALLLTYILLPIFGITGAGIAWTLSQTAMALLIGVWLLRPLFAVTRKEGHHDF